MIKIIRFKDRQGAPCEQMANAWLENMPPMKIIDFGTNTMPQGGRFISEIFIIYKVVDKK